MESLDLLKSSPLDYPNRLASPHPERFPSPSSRWLLLILVIACLIPRVFVALRTSVICVDGPVFVQIAQALEAGNYRTAIFEGGWNIYPIILMVLHRLGFGWEAAGAIWGVAVSSLVVLPLWGWIRRQFDDRVALVACLLYIVHPKFIIESPEVTRDPTFWLLFTASIYYLWRAVTEVRYRYFFIAGMTITLSALTRVEGLFLLIPLVLWTLWRWLALETDRKKLLIGVVLGTSAFPALLLLINVVVLHDYLGWATIRVSPLARVRPWFESLLGLDPVAEADRTGPPVKLDRMLWIFFPTMTRGLAPVYALLMFGGIWRWRRVWARRDHQALFYTAMVIVCGIWVQLWYDGNLSRRYPLPIVLMASPFAALALLWLAALAGKIAERIGWSIARRRLAAAVTMTIFLVAGLGHAVKTVDESRVVAAEVSRFVKNDFATPPMMAGPSFMLRIVNFYSSTSGYVILPTTADDTSILELVADNRPDVVVLWPTKYLTPERCTSLIERLKSSGLTPIRPDALPESSGKFHVLVRAEKLVRAETTARRQ